MLRIFLVSILSVFAVAQAQADDPKVTYPAMVPVDQYLISDVNAEVALARTAAPASLSGTAEVMVLGKTGYITAAKGSNGFTCLVERGWGAATTDPNYWNPRMRAPICFNAAATRSFLPIYLMKTKLLLAGKSKAEVLKATDAAFASKQLPPLEPGAMCYMMSKQQHLNDGATPNWHSHLMFFVAGDVAKSWGADLTGSPIVSADDPEERATIFMVPVGTWSDGTPAPAMHMD